MRYPADLSRVANTAGSDVLACNNYEATAVRAALVNRRRLDNGEQKREMEAQNGKKK